FMVSSPAIGSLWNVGLPGMTPPTGQPRLVGLGPGTVLSPFVAGRLGAGTFTCSVGLVRHLGVVAAGSFLCLGGSRFAAGLITTCGGLGPSLGSSRALVLLLLTITAALL